jgi:high-affinity iron transporter
VWGVVVLVVGQAACAPRPSVEEGRALFKANGCANCHGPEGHGDGRLGPTLDRRPRDFRDIAAFKGGINESAIAATIAFGLGPGAGQMPQFAHLTEEERRSLALFVISLGGDRNANRATGEP